MQLLLPSFAENEMNDKTRGYALTSVYESAVKLEIFENTVNWMLTESEKDEPGRSASCLHAATQTKNLRDLEQILVFAFEKVRSSQFLSIIGGLLDNSVTSQTMWNFIDKYFQVLEPKIDGNHSGLYELFSVFSTREDYEKVSHFFKTHGDVTKHEKTKKQTLEKILNKILWTEENSSDLSNYLLSRHNHHNE